MILKNTIFSERNYNIFKSKWFVSVKNNDKSQNSCKNWDMNCSRADQSIFRKREVAKTTPVWGPVLIINYVRTGSNIKQPPPFIIEPSQNIRRIFVATLVEPHEPAIKSGQGCPRGNNLVNSKSGFNCTIIYVKLWVYKEYRVFTEGPNMESVN